MTQQNRYMNQGGDFRPRAKPLNKAPLQRLVMCSTLLFVSLVLTVLTIQFGWSAARTAWEKHPTTAGGQYDPGHAEEPYGIRMMTGSFPHGS